MKSAAFEATSVLNAIVILNARYLVEFIKKQHKEMLAAFSRLSAVLDFVDCFEEAVKNLLPNAANFTQLDIYKKEEYVRIRTMKVYYFEDEGYPEMPEDIAANFQMLFVRGSSVVAKGKNGVAEVLSKLITSNTKLYNATDITIVVNDKLLIYPMTTPAPESPLSQVESLMKRATNPIVQVSDTVVKTVPCLSLQEVMRSLSPTHESRSKLHKKIRHKSKHSLRTQKIGNISLYLDSVLGYGSTGAVVYSGLFQDRKVAVKRIPLHMHEIVTSEIATLMAVDSHPNMIRYFAKEEDARYAYLAIESCKGTLEELIQFYSLPEAKRKDRSLYEVLGQSELNDDMKMGLIKGIIEGLHYLHANNIVHKNLKPTNILITGTRKAKLSDIGCYRQISGEKAKNSEDWEPPESGTQAARRKEGDVFALGCIIYYVLTGGKHPFAGPEVRKNIVAGKYDLSSASSFDAQYLVEHMICRVPAKRYHVDMCRNYILFWGDEKVLNFVALISAAVLSMGLRRENRRLGSVEGL